LSLTKFTLLLAVGQLASYRILHFFHNTSVMVPLPQEDGERRPLKQGDYGAIRVTNDHDNSLEMEEADDGQGKDQASSVPPPSSTSSDAAHRVLIKTQGSFWEDARDFAPGSIPHSAVLALTIGCVCGVAAWLYYMFLEWALDFLWHDLPERFVIDYWPEYLYVLWIPLIGFGMAVGLGIVVKVMGEPGDLPYTVKCVHEKGYVAMNHVMPMVMASQCSILAGGSLGPEAPLVAICAALGGFVSRSVFGMTDRNLVRKHTLMVRTICQDRWSCHGWLRWFETTFSLRLSFVS
jgi:hypothetical protein